MARRRSTIELLSLIICILPNARFLVNKNCLAFDFLKNIAYNEIMDKELLQELKKKLEEEKTNLEKDLETFADKDRKVPHDYDTRYPNLDDNTDTAAPDSNAQEINAFDNLLAIEHLLELRLKDVEEALNKIKKNDGSYGKCEVCHNEIEISRLKVNPAAKLCAKCASQQQNPNK